MEDKFKCIQCDRCLEDPMQICQRSQHISPVQRIKPVRIDNIFKKGIDMAKTCDICGYQVDNWHNCRTLKEDVENCPEFISKSVFGGVKPLSQSKMDLVKDLVKDVEL